MSVRESVNALLIANSSQEIQGVISELHVSEQHHIVSLAIDELVDISEENIKSGNTKEAIMDLSRLAILEDYLILVERVYAKQGIM